MRYVVFCLSVSLLLGCASTQPVNSVRPSDNSARPTAVKRVVAAIQSTPVTLNLTVNPPGSGVPGQDVLQTLVGSGLAMEDNQGRTLPLLAETVPTLENGLWTLLPTGGMETTWRLRPSAAWHDGTPFTAPDLVFTATVLQDRELDILPEPGYESVEAMEVKDPKTLVVRWKRPYIRADQLFNAPPLPKHLLERTFLDNKPGFTQLTYWTNDFVGTGPFRLRQFEGSSHLILAASPTFVLGQPRIDEIEVKFIPDPSTLSANLLAGAVEVTLGRSLSLEEAIQVRDQWREGTMQVALSGWIVPIPQLMNPNPAILTDVRFRRALMHGLDRETMAETLMFGQVPVAHTFLSPTDPQYPAIEPQIVRYPFDPRQATSIIESLGYAKASDGVFRDGAGQRLTMEIRSSAGRALNNKATLTIADNWQRIGIAAESALIPQQRSRDREYVQTFPGFTLYNQPNDLNSLNRLRSSQTPLPENSYVGNNNSRYVNAEFDALIERHFATIPLAERTQVLGQVIHHMTDNLNLFGIVYNAEPMMLSNRITGATSRRGEATTQTWNVQTWDVAS